MLMDTVDALECRPKLAHRFAEKKILPKYGGQFSFSDFSTYAFEAGKRVMPESKKSPTDVFLAASVYAVAGASRNRAKYGNKVFQALVASGRTTFPLNPAAYDVEGHTAYASIFDLPAVPESLSIVTPPLVTRSVIEQAIAAGVRNVWMQPGAEDLQSSQLARDAGLNVIDDGSCILVSLAVERHT